MTESDAKVIKLSRTRQTAKIRKSNQNLYSDGYALIMVSKKKILRKNHIRMLLRRLRQTLGKYGIPDIIESNYGKMRVLPDKFDYYQYMDGKKELFTGEYMGTYIWAEEERAFLNF